MYILNASTTHPVTSLTLTMPLGQFVSSSSYFMLYMNKKMKTDVGPLHTLYKYEMTFNNFVQFTRNVVTILVLMIHDVIILVLVKRCLGPKVIKQY